MNQVTTIKKLLEKSPVLLLVSMSIGFLITFIFFSCYYVSYLLVEFNIHPIFVFIMGIGAAAMVELARFSFALSGSYSFATGNEKTGKIGIIMSGLITIWKIFEAWQATGVMSESKFFYSLLMFLISCIVISFAIEIRLSMSMADEVLNISKMEAMKGGKKRIVFDKLSPAQRVDFIGMTFERLSKEMGREPTLQMIKDEIKGKTALSTIRNYLKIYKEKTDVPN